MPNQGERSRVHSIKDLLRLLIGSKDNPIRCAVGIAVAHRALASGSMSRS